MNKVFNANYVIVTIYDKLVLVNMLKFYLKPKFF